MSSVTRPSPGSHHIVVPAVQQCLHPCTRRTNNWAGQFRTRRSKERFLLALTVRGTNLKKTNHIPLLDLVTAGQNVTQGTCCNFTSQQTQQLKAPY